MKERVFESFGKRNNSSGNKKMSINFHYSVLYFILLTKYLFGILYNYLQKNFYLFLKFLTFITQSYQVGDLIIQNFKN